MANQTIFRRVSKDKNYSVINNGFLRRKDLSWRAKGIMAYLLMLPDDWIVNLNEIVQHATEGERAFRKAWKELVEKGYINRFPVRAGNQIDYWQTEIHEDPGQTNAQVLQHGNFVQVENEYVQNEVIQSEGLQNEAVQNGKLLSTYNTKYLKDKELINTNIIQINTRENQEHNDKPLPPVPLVKWITNK